MIKKLLIITLFSSFIISNAMASGYERKHNKNGFHYGARIGTNIINRDAGRFHGMGEIFGEYRTAKSFGLNLGISFSQQIMQVGLGNSCLDPIYAQTNVLSVPLTFNFYVSPSFSINLGAVYGFILNQNIPIWNENNLIHATSIPLGVTYYAPFGLFADIRYHVSMKSFTQISVGYKF